MNRPPERPAWRDILAFPLSGLSLRLFFLILGLILLLAWQLVLRAGHLIEQTAQHAGRHSLQTLAQLLADDITRHHLDQQKINLAPLAAQLDHLPTQHTIILRDPAGNLLYQNSAAAPTDRPAVIQPVPRDGTPLAQLHIHATADQTPPALATLRRVALTACLIALILLAALAWWLARALRRISHYAEAMAAGIPAPSPEYADIYLKRLAQSVTTLRRKLNGKAHVEHYIHSLTHELKTPLTAILAASEFLREPLSDAEHSHFLAQIERHSAQMQTLIERLLDLARLENRDTLANPQATDLKTLLEQIAHDHQPLLAGKNLTLQLSLAPATIHGDPLLIRHAVQNLLANAIDFARPNSAIRITLAAHGKHTAIRIENRGDPIPAYALPRLFERFFSLPRPDTGKKSSGLGLAFAERIMTLHGGTITLANLPDGVQASLIFPTPNKPPAK